VAYRRRARAGRSQPRDADGRGRAGSGRVPARPARFAVSDIVQPTPESPWVFAFTRVGENHHDVALALGDGGGKLHHVAFQVNGVGEVVHFADRLGRFGWKIEAGVGRHGPGGNTFLYVRDPFGNRVEITADVARVPNRWEPPKVWTGDLSAIFNVWTEEPPPASFAEGT